MPRANSITGWARLVLSTMLFGCAVYELHHRSDAGVAGEVWVRVTGEVCHKSSHFQA